MLTAKIKNNKIIRAVAAIVVFVGVIGGALWLSRAVSQDSQIQEFILKHGYWGTFLVAIASGFNLVVPVPAISFLPALVEAGLNFWLTIAIITVGMTLGDSLGYLLGYAGRELSHINNSKVFTKLDTWSQEHANLPLVVMFLYACFVPLPNEILVIPLAALGYKYWHIAVSVLLGNLVFNTLAAYGLTNLFEAIL